MIPVPLHFYMQNEMFEKECGIYGHTHMSTHTIASAWNQLNTKPKYQINWWSVKVIRVLCVYIVYSLRTHTHALCVTYWETIFVFLSFSPLSPSNYTTHGTIQFYFMDAVMVSRACSLLYFIESCGQMFCFRMIWSICVSWRNKVSFVQHIN